MECITNSLHAFGVKMCLDIILSTDIICSKKQTVFLEQRNCELWGTDIQGKISEHIFQARWKLLSLLSFKCFLQHIFIFSWGIFSHIFSHVMHLDKSCASENIWIKMLDTCSVKVRWYSIILFYLHIENKEQFTKFIAEELLFLSPTNKIPR